MSNEDLDRRICEDFLGWTYVQAPGRIYYANKDGNFCMDYNFSPTTDARAAYVVLEKIASSLDVRIEKRSDTNWGAYFDDENGHAIGVEHDELPFAISRLAEMIMDSSEHMELFK